MRNKYLLKDDCCGATALISITSEQADLLEWLWVHEWLKEDVSYALLEDAECVEI